MKYLSSIVWITDEKIMLIYLKTGNKRGIIMMKVLVSRDHHYCLRCPYNPECGLTCYCLEMMSELQEKVKEEFGIGLSLLHITPLRIERLRAKFRPDESGNNRRHGLVRIPDRQE